jgi:hypothetical protein
MNNLNLLPPPNGTDTIVLLDIQYLKKKSTIVIKEISALFYPSGICISELFSHSRYVGGSVKENCTNNYVINKLHGLDFHSGNIPYYEIKSFVNNNILKPNIAIVIVKGELKKQYIEQVFHIPTINIETVFPNMPKYTSFPKRYHCRYEHFKHSQQFCSYRNVKNLHKYLEISATGYLQHLYESIVTEHVSHNRNINNLISIQQENKSEDVPSHFQEKDGKNDKENNSEDISEHSQEEELDKILLLSDTETDLSDETEYHSAIDLSSNESMELDVENV